MHVLSNSPPAAIWQAAWDRGEVDVLDDMRAQGAGRELRRLHLAGTAPMIHRPGASYDSLAPRPL